MTVLLPVIDEVALTVDVLEVAIMLPVPLTVSVALHETVPLVPAKVPVYVVETCGDTVIEPPLADATVPSP